MHVMAAVLAIADHFTLTDTAYNMLVGTAIPIVVAVLARQRWSAGAKAVTNLLLTAVAGALTTAATTAGDVNVRTFVVGIGMTWVSSIATYYGLWKPSQVAPTVMQATG